MTAEQHPLSKVMCSYKYMQRPTRILAMSWLCKESLNLQHHDLSTRAVFDKASRNVTVRMGYSYAPRGPALNWLSCSSERGTLLCLSHEFIPARWC